MRIIIEKSGYIIPHTSLVEAVCRFDLIPVPVSIEFKILNNKDTKALNENDVILIQDDEIPMRIIKKNEDNPDLIQGDTFISISSFIAVLDGCERLIEPASAAKIFEETSFNDAYRAFGIKIPFGSDIPLLNFNAFYGKTPSYEVARRCCEEAAVIFFKNRKLHAMRLNELLKNEPLLDLNGLGVVWETNPQIEKNIVQNYVTLNPDGSTIEESLKSSQSANYYPGVDTRRLKNLRTVLIRRGSVIRQLSTNIVAGDIVRVDDVPYIIMTAAHMFKTGVLGGNSAMLSRFWIAEVNEQ